MRRRRAVALALFGISAVGLGLSGFQCWHALSGGMIQPLSLSYDMSIPRLLDLRASLLLSLGGLVLAWLLYPKAEQAQPLPPAGGEVWSPPPSGGP